MLAAKDSKKKSHNTRLQMLNKMIGFDIETDGLPHYSKFKNGALHSFSGGTAYYTDIKEFTTQLKKALFAGYHIAGHKCVTFDLPVLAHHDESLLPVLFAHSDQIHDTLIYSQYVSPYRRRHSMLSYVENDLLMYPDCPRKVDIDDWENVSMEKLEERVRDDAVISSYIVKYLIEEKFVLSLYKDWKLRKSFYPIVVEMLAKGIPLNAEIADKKLLDLNMSIAGLRVYLTDFLQYDKIQSPQKIQEALDRHNTRIKLPLTDKGTPSLNKDNISEFLSRHDFFPRYESYKELKAQLDFIKKENMGARSMFLKYKDGYFHPSLNYVGTRTGRMQYTEPPANQIDKRIRDVVRVNPERETMVGVDVTALEEMILGHTLREAFGDSTLCDNIINGADAKQLTIDALGDLCDYFKGTSNWTIRDAAKRLNYAFLYGGGLTLLCHIIGAPPNRTNQDKMRAALRRRYPNCDRLQNAIAKTIRKDRTVRNMFNTKVPSGPDHCVLNTWCQSSGADYAQRVFSCLHYFIRKDLKGRAVLYNHDEMQFIVPEPNNDSLMSRVVECKNKAKEKFEREFKFPWITDLDVNIGIHWGETH